MKVCSCCGQKLPKTNFSRSHKDKIHNVCKSCRSAKAQDYANTREGRIYRLSKDAKKRAKKKGIEYSISDSFWDRVDEGMLCDVTGVPMSMSSADQKCMISLDRIDSSKGYTDENCRLVCYAVNMACGPWGWDEFVDLVKPYFDCK